MKAFLAQKHNVLSQQQGTGYISLPTCDQPGGLVLHSTPDKPTFMPDSTEQYIEMYRMMADRFRQNRDKVLLLLELLKESLFENPIHSLFMMWVSIAMMHSENYPQFKVTYDPRSFMRVDSSEYHALQDRYLALNVPLGIKKIPVVFILFEIPRFYHYVDFLN